jgi:hypothetical protein
MCLRWDCAWVGMAERCWMMAFTVKVMDAPLCVLLWLPMTPSFEHSNLIRLQSPCKLNLLVNNKNCSDG